MVFLLHVAEVKLITGQTSIGSQTLLGYTYALRRSEIPYISLGDEPRKYHLMNIFLKKRHFINKILTIKVITLLCRDNVTKNKKGAGYINLKVQYVFNIILVDITTSRLFDAEEQSSKVSCKDIVLETFAEFAGKQRYWSLFLNKGTCLHLET